MERPESILIKNGLLLTMQGEGVGSIPDGAVAIQDGEIVAVGKTHRVEPQHRDAEVVIDAQGKAVLPGFVDGHIHTGLSILRGLAQDVPEIEWMLKTLAPFTPHIEARHQVAGSRLGVLEALKAGTTTFGEIGGNMAPLVEQVFLPMGVRANVANTINQIGPDSRPDPHKPYVFYEDVGEEKLRRALELVDRFDGADGGRITVMFAPHGADMMDTSLLLRVREEALSRGKLIHIHVAQGGREEIQMRLRYGKTTVQYLDELGYLDGHLIAAHCHQTTDQEVQLLAKKGVRYASCPASIAGIDGITPPLGLYLASGGPHATLGSDQAPGNGHHNMLVEMKVAALLNKTRHRDPTVLPAWKTLRLATVEGARTLGLGDRVGSLEPGKRADIVLLDLKKPHMAPLVLEPFCNVAPNIVYSARGDEVTHVLVDGRLLVEEGVVKTVDEGRVVEEAQRAGAEVAGRGAQAFLEGDGWLAREAKRGLY